MLKDNIQLNYSFVISIELFPLRWKMRRLRSSVSELQGQVESL